MSPRPVFRLPSSRRRAEADVEREFDFHLAMREADLVAAGMSPDEARAEARRSFGDRDVLGAECRAEEGERQARARLLDRLDTLRRDLALAARSLRRAPGFTAAAALTLGIGLGAATAVFSVVDATLLRPLPLREPARVVALVPHAGGEPRAGSPGFLHAWSAQSRSLARVAAVADRRATLVAGGEAQRVGGAAVSGAFFDVLGVAPALGRAITAADDAPEAPAVVVLAHDTWTHTFSGDSALVGRAITLDGRPRTVVGVMPASLDAATGGAAFWVPLALPASQRENYTPYLSLVGRLAPGATPEGAARELDAVVTRLGPRAADDAGVFPTVRVVPLARWLLADYETPIALMLGAVAAVLLIGCANVSTLVLARSVTRARELAVRASLGAGLGRLVRQLAVEHLLLGALATAVAVPVAALSVRALVATVPAEVPRLGAVSLDVRALAFAAALGILASLLCGVAPALHRRRLDVGAALHGGTRAGGDRRGERWRRVFVGAEVALAFALVVGAGLLLRSAGALARVRPGYDVSRVLTARLALPPRDYPSLGGAVRALDGILASARTTPGVSAAALASRVPLGGSAGGVDVALDDRPLDRASNVGAALRVASDGYFRAMGIPLVAGRDLARGDRAGAPRVVVVNAALARRLAGGAPVVGRRIRSDNGAFADSAGTPLALEIVGVVADVRESGPRHEPEPAFFVPVAQVPEEPFTEWFGREMLLVARGAGEPASLAASLRRAVAAVDPRLPLYDVQSTGERLSRALAVERFETGLLSLLGALGLLLAALGIHGVVAYAAGRRAREVGVRLALGATAPQAVSLVVRQSMRPVVVGLVIGGVAAVAAARAARGLLFGVAPHDPVTLLGAATVLALAGIVAAAGPARRVARVDPVTSLRAD